MAENFSDNFSQRKKKKRKKTGKKLNTNMVGTRRKNSTVRNALANNRNVFSHG